MKKLSLIVLILTVISAGIGYSIYRSPDLPLQNMYRMALAEFAKNAEPLEQIFIKDGQLKPQSQRIEFYFSTLEGEQKQVVVQLISSISSVTLAFGNGEFALAGESIVLEPRFEQEVFRWKCINGSVLVRVRTKNCRLGLGETRESMLTYQ